MSERIRLLRQHLKLSQEAFAKKMGMTRSMISNLELGLIEIPDYKLEMIGKTFNVNMHWLRTGEGEMFNPVKPSLDALAEAHQISDLARAIIGGLGDMQPAHRDALVGLILDVGERIRNADYDAAQPENVAASLQYNEFLSAARAESPSDEDLPDIAEPRTE